jgi:choline dehydrogenase
MSAGTHDFIVVGAGSAGCALAARLSESGKYSVLLLEAGPRNSSVWLKLPIGYGRTFYDPSVNWMYETEPVPGLGGRRSYWPRGKVLGGSSSINAMVYSRGQASDFDEWEALGNPGWGWKDVLAAYRRLEDHDIGDSPFHGKGGPLHVTTIEHAAHPLTRLFIEAAVKAGLALNPDLNGETIEGVGYYQITTRGGFRESAATAYLRVPRRNLRIETGVHVTRLLFDESLRVVGVSGWRGDRLLEFRARREAILSAGTIGSAQLLLLSGIGPAAALNKLGIEVVRDCAMVGRNLQDHLCYDHIYLSHVPSLNNLLRPWSGRVRVGLQYALFRKGPLSLSLNQAGGFYRSGPAARFPDMQLYIQPLSYERAPPRKRPLMSPDPFAGFSTSISPCKPKSVGHLELSSPDWRAPPPLHPNYLSDPRDIGQMLDGARFLRRLAATPPLATAVKEELKPGMGRNPTKN